MYFFFQTAIPSRLPGKGRDSARMEDPKDLAEPTWPHAWTSCTLYLSSPVLQGGGQKAKLSTAGWGIQLTCPLC